MSGLMDTGATGAGNGTGAGIAATPPAAVGKAAVGRTGAARRKRPGR